MKICIIKLGADGDVLRTLPIVKAIKDKYPNSEITWVAKGDIIELLRGNSGITKVISLPYEERQSFDILYNFDIDEEACNLAMSIDAKEKYGFYFENKYPLAFNVRAEYYLNTLFDDYLKKTNNKTYQEMMFEVAELSYEKEPYIITLNGEDIKYARNFAENNNIKNEKLVGIHLGASSRWPSKVWNEERLKEFIRKVKEKDYEILLFGGPNEIDWHHKLAKELENQGIKIFRNNPNNTKREFLSLVSLCKAMICSDSFSLHVSLALQKPTIGLFFCTSPEEVEGYNLLRKITSKMQKDFFPERMNEYNEELTKSISADDVLSALEDIMKNKS